MATKHAFTRALPLTIFGASLFAVAAVGIPVRAADQTVSPVITINKAAATADITTTPIRDNLSMLDGSGGNITVLTGTDGKFMVDAGIAVTRVKIAAALDKISNAPLKYLVDTHYHWDHTDGNPWVHDAGATIIATANTKKHVTTPETRVDDWDFTFKALAPGGVPTVIVNKPTTYNFDGQTILLVPVPPAHTDSDLYVYFKQADVLVVGDLFWNSIYPFIDNEQGGNIDGMIRADNLILAVATDKTIIVPGHGTIGNRQQLTEFRDMLVGIRKNVAALKKQGKSLAEVIAAKPTAAYDAKYGQFVIGPDLFTKIVYDGLK
jgi:glyoxylase-like metal-dependent hydrolase (beta-lactamase superfamily II)